MKATVENVVLDADESKIHDERKQPVYDHSHVKPQKLLPVDSDDDADTSSDSKYKNKIEPMPEKLLTEEEKEAEMKATVELMRKDDLFMKVIGGEPTLEYLMKEKTSIGQNSCFKLILL